ncbi:MAG: DUF2335 domain-containing protein [Gemmatimonadetes bacterium]|nr:DUF2335 domain-containing protein [Gemmatimonadota bacterium]
MVEQRIKSLVVEASLHIGPIPDPEDLKRYESILPGLADRIVTMAEKEQEERFTENKRGQSQFNTIMRGAFSLMGLGIMMSFYLLAFEDPPQRNWWFFLLFSVPHLLSQIRSALRRDKKPSSPPSD